MTTPPLTGIGIPGAEWTFWADRAVPPHEPIGPVACSGFTCSWVLNGYGAGEAVIPIEGGGLTRDDLLQFYGWRLWAFYADQPVWAGLPTDLDDDGGAAVTMAFTELPGYLLKKQHATTSSYRNTEQTTIGTNLAARLDNIGVEVFNRFQPGRPRDRDYAYLEGTSRGDLLANLADVIDGPEFRSEYRMIRGRPLCSLKVAYPRAGFAGGLGLVVPGGAQSFKVRWSSGRQRTRTFAVGELPEGAGANDRAPVEVVVRDQPGIPAIDEVDNWPGVVLRSTLQERAATNAASYARPVMTLDATMPVASPVIGSYGVGDDVDVLLTDALMPGGLAVTARLLTAQANAGQGTVAWTVSTVLPPPRPRESLTARLGYLDGMTSGMFHTNLEAPPGGIEP